MEDEWIASTLFSMENKLRNWLANHLQTSGVKAQSSRLISVLFWVELQEIKNISWNYQTCNLVG
jgi:hypothetical protein